MRYAVYRGFDVIFRGFRRNLKRQIHQIFPGADKLHQGVFDITVSHERGKIYLSHVSGAYATFRFRRPYLHPARTIRPDFNFTGRLFTCCAILPAFFHFED